MRLVLKGIYRPAVRPYGGCYLQTNRQIWDVQEHSSRQPVNTQDRASKKKKIPRTVEAAAGYVCPSSAASGASAIDSRDVFIRYHRVPHSEQRLPPHIASNRQRTNCLTDIAVSLSAFRQGAAYADFCKLLPSSLFVVPSLTLLAWLIITVLTSIHHFVIKQLTQNDVAAQTTLVFFIRKECRRQLAVSDSRPKNKKVSSIERNKEQLNVIRSNSISQPSAFSLICRTAAGLYL